MTNTDGGASLHQVIILKRITTRIKQGFDCISYQRINQFAQPNCSFLTSSILWSHSLKKHPIYFKTISVRMIKTFYFYFFFLCVCRHLMVSRIFLQLLLVSCNQIEVWTVLNKKKKCGWYLLYVFNFVHEWKALKSHFQQHLIHKKFDLSSATQRSCGWHLILHQCSVP